MTARTSAVAGALAMALAGGPALAVGVDPPVVDRAADPGTSFTVDKVVHTPAIPPKPDIVLAVDTTGSMGGAITDVRTNLSEIVADVRASQPSAQFAVVSYRDVGDGAQLFQVRTPLTGVEADIQTGVNSLAAGGGGDFPEAWVNALYQISTGAITYRADSSRIVVLVGDAPSHDPSAGHTLGAATAELIADGARVVAVNVANLDFSGQATQVATDTGGSLVAVGSGADAVTAAILAGLHDLDVTVTPDVVGCDSGLSVSFDKGAVTITSGGHVSYVETVTVAADASQGAVLHCTVRFLLNGTDAGDAFVERINVRVNDTTPPVVTVNDQTVEATSPAGAVINYPATAVDNVDGPLTPTCVPPPGSTFPVGNTGVACTATDAAGNTGSDTAVMHVVDTTPPVVSCDLGPEPDGNVPASDAGYRTLTGTDIADADVAIYVKDTASTAVFGPYASGTNIKLTQAAGSTPSVKPGSGAVHWNIKLKGDALIEAVDDSGNKVSVICRVPQPPK